MAMFRQEMMGIQLLKLNLEMKLRTFRGRKDDVIVLGDQTDVHIPTSNALMNQPVLQSAVRSQMSHILKDGNL